METIIIAVLGVVVIAAVAIPLLRGGGGHHDAREYEVHRGTPTSPSATAGAGPPDADGTLPGLAGGDGAVEAEIARYRLAVAAGTVCSRCGEANAADARFCGDCGRRLPTSNEDAQEFA